MLNKNTFKIPLKQILKYKSMTQVVCNIPANFVLIAESAFLALPRFMLHS